MRAGCYAVFGEKLARDWPDRLDSALVRIRSPQLSDRHRHRHSGRPALIEQGARRRDDGLRIPHGYEEYDGDHTDHVKERSRRTWCRSSRGTSSRRPTRRQRSAPTWSIAYDLRDLAREAGDAETDAQIRPLILHLQVPPKRADDGPVEHGSGDADPDLKIGDLRDVGVGRRRAARPVVPVEEHEVHPEARLEHPDARVSAMVVIEAVIHARRGPEVHGLEDDGVGARAVRAVFAE